MRKPFIAGNWKMQLDRKGASKLAAGVHAHSGVDVLIAPAFIHLSDVAKAMTAGVLLAAQTLASHINGAYTGEVSGEMLLDIGCKFVLVGHSERRALFAETDSLVALKFARAQASGLTPILCIGETLAEREAGRTEVVVTRQLSAVLNFVGVAAFAKALISYEPVWAIGTGKTASPEQAQAVHAHIRSQISGRDASIAGSARILYGGSVKSSNVQALMLMPDIDGALVGGASLNAEEFNNIVAAAV